MPNRDAIAGLAVAAASLFLFWLTLGLERNPLVPIGPAFYPRIVLGVTAVLALALAVFSLLRKESPREAKKDKANYLAVAVQFVLFGLYVVLLPPLGFRIATFLYVAAANLVLDPPRRALQWLRAPLLAAITATACYYVFEGYLQVLMPRGAWTDF